MKPDNFSVRVLLLYSSFVLSTGAIFLINKASSVKRRPFPLSIVPKIENCNITHTDDKMSVLIGPLFPIWFYLLLFSHFFGSVLAIIIIFLMMIVTFENNIHQNIKRPCNFIKSMYPLFGKCFFFNYHLFCFET